MFLSLMLCLSNKLINPSIFITVGCGCDGALVPAHRGTLTGWPAISPSFQSAEGTSVARALQLPSRACRAAHKGLTIPHAGARTRPTALFSPQIHPHPKPSTACTSMQFVRPSRTAPGSPPVFTCAATQMGRCEAGVGIRAVVRVPVSHSGVPGMIPSSGQRQLPASTELGGSSGQSSN